MEFGLGLDPRLVNGDHFGHLIDSKNLSLLKVSHLMRAELCCELWIEDIVTLKHNPPDKKNSRKTMNRDEPRL